MGQKKKQFKPVTRGYLLMENEMFHHQAFKTISNASTIKIMLYFLHRTYRKNHKKRGLEITNNGRIDATYRQIQEAMGIKHRSSVTCALRELIEERGLIDRVDVGRWDMKTPSIYGLSDRWRKYGTDEYEPAKLDPVPKAWKV